METGVIVSLAAYFVAMLGIGLWAWRKSTADIDGYLLGGRELSARRWRPCRPAPRTCPAG